MGKRRKSKPAPAPAPDLQERQIAWLQRLQESTLHPTADVLVLRLCKRWNIDPALIRIA